MKVKLWQDWVILVAAAWLFVSPFVLDYAVLADPASWVAWACSVVLFVSASEALVIPDAIEEWVDGLAGLLLVVSPWVFGFAREMVPAVNAVVTGTVVVFCAMSALIRDRKMGAPGHHWPAAG